jgi:hypothetical protein
MRGQIDGILTMNGDKYYDYGKMYQSILGYDLILNGNIVNTEYLERMKDLFLKKSESIGLNINYLSAVTRSLIFGTIPFIEKRETKDRVWKFIKSI